ncbi:MULTISPECIES: hypothetical protein [unclassified Streptomyces]|uniref:hypothetical protein n=1 Tax=unclassified Streptomyces TaxID=2593676 RepID=UPI00342B5E1D
MGLSFSRNPDGTTTGHNTETGFTFTAADAEEVKRRVYEDAGWEYTPPPPPVAPGCHRFALADDSFDAGGFGAERYAGLRSDPPAGCAAEDWGSFALLCERPGVTLLDAVAGAVAEIRRDHGLVMNSLGIEKPDEWLDSDRDGHAGRIVAHLLLMAVHRAVRAGYGRADLVRLLDATGIE